MKGTQFSRSPEAFLLCMKEAAFPCLCGSEQDGSFSMRYPKFWEGRKEIGITAIEVKDKTPSELRGWGTAHSRPPTNVCEWSLLYGATTNCTCPVFMLQALQV